VIVNAAVKINCPVVGPNLIGEISHGRRTVSKIFQVVVNAAVKINCQVVGPNLIGEISHGPWKGQVYGGQSVAFDPKNNKMVVGKDRENDLVIITIELAAR